ncbi:single-pass membrane and coiled-coil domain-containing protein 3-like [Acipenser oxyrinchus oxyrinchus]|uniref:Single-pass membrane and coiled-coil domain-containing protein 3-like n=1 Tax=Acipenser oxyrinchus oxyrinchus TaxID=40147 RepID=A0AAD8CDK1_ACIOX|nr:single-pass membrane and coiled-coil domain-containing protein 3-like [Acipenser oxyrinchus oxyrinchus]
MSWKDIFYPNNPKYRDEIIRMTQELESLMENNFRATNRLSKLFNEEFSTSLREIKVDRSKSIKENCYTLIGAIREIQNEVAKIDEELKEKLEPDLYKKLSDLSVPITDRIQIASKVLIGSIGILGAAASVALISLISKGVILTRVVSSVGKIATSVVGSIGLGVVMLGVDMIASAILGAIERDHLEKVIEEYNLALLDFKPASEEYQDHIFEVWAEVKHYKKKKK